MKKSNGLNMDSIFSALDNIEALAKTPNGEEEDFQDSIDRTLNMIEEQIAEIKSVLKAKNVGDNYVER